MVNVVATDACPDNRVYVFGAPAKLSNPRYSSEIVGDEVRVTVTYDVEYEPIKCAVIRLDP